MMAHKFMAQLYCEELESLCTRILYFFNTIDTYCYVAGIIAAVISGMAPFNPGNFLLSTAAVWLSFKIADFSIIFLALSPIPIGILFWHSSLNLFSIIQVLIINLVIFAIVQFVFMSIPEIIIVKDISISVRKFWNSIFTIAQTTVSLPVSVGYSTVYSVILVSRVNPVSKEDSAFWFSIFIVAIISAIYRPRSFHSPDVRPKIKKRISERVIVLNIDGCRLDKFYEARLSYLTLLRKEGTYFPAGIQTVYRGLTNPAFASILTGVTPEIHGVKSNNFGQRIKVEGLPDIVESKLYGSMHVKHFSKPHWVTKIVSLPTHGIFRCDDIMLDWLKEDLRKQDATRLFIADISEVDLIGHSYGSDSWQYLSALKRTDQRIKEFINYLSQNDLLHDMTIIICSDHGMFKIDHSYLLFDAERYVPFIMFGNKIKADNALNFMASITDIAANISYILGIAYPGSCKGRVFTEAFL
jgi:hypothetical protein